MFSRVDLANARQCGDLVQCDAFLLTYFFDVIRYYCGMFPFFV